MSMDMLGGMGQQRARMAAALRGGLGMGGGGLPGGQPTSPSSLTGHGPPGGTTIGAPVTTGSMGGGGGMGRGGMGGGGGWQQMPLGQAFTSYLDAIGSTKGGAPLPKGTGSFMIGPDARQYIPNYKPGQVQAVYKPNTFNLGGKKHKAAE